MRLTLLIVLVALAGSSIQSFAADRWVSRHGNDSQANCLVPSAPCQTVEKAAFVATSGDTINVAAGKYKVRLELRSSKTLALLGGWDATFSARDPVATPTVLKARTDFLKDKRVVVVIAKAGQAIALTIDGFVLTGGNARSSSYLLTGIPGLIPPQDGGGGLYALAAGGDVAVTVRRSVITRNQSRGGRAVGVAGGAFVGAVGGTAEVTFDRTIISDNRAEYAGGIEVLSYGDSATSAHVQVVNSIITRNRVEGSAAIFAIRFGGAPCVLDLINSTVTANEGSTERGEEGEGAIVLNQATANITNTILWGNTLVPPDPGADLDVGQDAVANVSYSDVGATDEVAGGILNDLGANVSVDPQLIGAALSGTSPLIDAGTCAGAPSEDFDGDPRPTGAGCDIGADELVP